jgi:hypothetical protein
LSAVFFFASENKSLRANASNPEFSMFQEWQLLHQRVYASEYDLMMRFGVWVANHHRINQVNSMNLNYTFGHNLFSDMTDKEAEEWIACANQPEEETELETVVDNVDAPATFDWGDYGYLNSV